ncbi:prophage tail fiber N-terminal domain-containing protein [Escherichia albertii]|uniref:prophage tail fiber N-terminal domain-containing protein n=1 Tax=Escherichia albertii TaxID=208962 RepID=UPI0011301727|nr:prophage tail fiber N-terminal domain-containing protein [Escherichia albertii]
MSVLISGALINGAGVPMAECKIYLDALVNTSEVVTESFAVIETGAAGEYVFEAPKGKYRVHIKQKNGPKRCVGEIAVYDDSKPGTLNDFLTALDEDDLKPNVVKRFEEMVAQAQQSAEAAVESERQAGQHAADAEQTKKDCKTLADNVQQNAEAVAEDRRQVEILASELENTAATVKEDAESAKKAASDAEQARDDIDTALSATLKTANRLSELADEEAQQESRDNLGLKSAALFDVQSDIHDRTEGRLALPGAMGFGALFSSKQKTFSAENGPTEFLQWVRETPPGRYLVSQYGGSKKKPIINAADSLVFSGYLDIEIRTNTTPKNQQKETKQATFKGINGEIYTVTISSNMTAIKLPDSWSKWLLKVDDFTRVLRSVTGNSWGSPGVDGLIFAAYFGESDTDDNRKLKRGQFVPGSRLGALTIRAKCSTSGSYASTPQFITVSPDSYPQAGTFVALSGEHLTTLGVSECFVGLFMRVA